MMAPVVEDCGSRATDFSFWGTGKFEERVGHLAPANARREFIHTLVDGCCCILEQCCSSSSRLYLRGEEFS